MDKTPMIYEEAEMTQFLNEFEKNFMQGGRGSAVIDSIKERAEIFLLMHRSWTEYDSKDKKVKYLDKAEWEKKVRTMLQLKHKMKGDTVNMMLGQYFTKVQKPRGFIV